jgi:AraC-like DNA-binding protein
MLNSCCILSGMLDDLKIGELYDGLLYLAEPAKNFPKMVSHRHAETEINQIVRGTITYVADGRRYTFKARTLIWFFPEQEHQLVAYSNDAQFYVATFKPSLIARSCRTTAYEGLKAIHNPENGLLSSILEADSFDLTRKTMDSLMRGSLDSDLLNREAGFGPGSNFTFEHSDPDGLNAGLHHLLLLCWRTQRSGRALGNAIALHPAVRRILKLLNDGESELSFTEMAKVCGISDAYLSRIFHRQIGVPLNQYRNSLRLARFLELYRQSEDPSLLEAAFTAGFGSYGQFYKVFKQAYGCGPKDCLVGRRLPSL